MIACEEVREKLPDYVYGLLPEWQMEEVAAHTQSCEACREAAEEAAREFRLLDAWEAPGPEGDTTPEFMRRLRLHENAGLARQSSGLDLLEQRRSPPAATLSGLIERFRAMPPGAKLAVSGLGLLTIAAVVAALLMGLSRPPGVAQGGHTKVIQGVPELGWQIGRTDCQLAALHAALVPMGCPYSHEELLVASGAAFTTCWYPRRYGWMTKCLAPEDLVLNAAEAAGAVADRLTYPSPEEAWDAICQSIDSGAPVWGWDGCAAVVIHGYDPDRRRIYVERYNDTQPDGWSPYEIKPAPWPLDRENEVVLLEYTPGDRPVTFDWPKILDRAVRFADWPPTQKLYRAWVFGLSAYDGWAATLRGGLGQEGPVTAAVLTRAYAQMLAEGRGAAAAVLREHADAHPAFAAAADAYAAEAEKLEQMPTVLSRGQPGSAYELQEMAETNIEDAKVRDAAAALVEECKDLDMAAVDALREALAELRAQPTQPVTAPAPLDQGAAAREHLARGKDLKAVGKLNEAAGELREAIAADDRLAEAHWVLAWVLVDLKDSEGAAKGFRRVIKLEPDTKRAQEAQQALGRLGK